MASLGGNIDGVNDCLACQRLAKQRDDPEIQRSSHVLGVTEARHQDHLRRKRATQRRTYGKAVGWRHDQIEKDDIRIVDGRGVQRLPSRRRGNDGVAFFFQPDRDQPGQFI